MDAHTQAPIPGPTRCLAALEELRGRLRRLLGVHGGLILALSAAGAAAASFALDYGLGLPRGVRAVLLVAASAALAMVLLRRVLAPLARPYPDEDLARGVEEENPELGQALITAVELTRPGARTGALVSPALLAAVVEDVERRAPTIHFHAILERYPLRRRVLAAAAALGALLAAGAARPDLAGTWCSRNLLLSASDWPKTTGLELVAPAPPYPTLVAMGDDLEVLVRVLKGAPPGVEMRMREGSSSLRSEPLLEVEPGLYRRVVPNVSRAFSFRVVGGDDALGDYEVDVRLRPRIDMQSMRVWCEYPAYTGIPSTPEDEPLRYGNVKAPAGTRVRFAMGTNVPVRRAFLVLNASRKEEAEKDGAGEAAAEAGAGWPDPGAVELEVEDGRRLAGGFDLVESGSYWIQMEGADGFRSARPDRFRLEAVPDQKPAARITDPDRMTEEVTLAAEVPVKVLASDDYGLASGTLQGVYYPPGKDEGLPWSAPLELAPVAPKEGAEGAASSAHRGGPSTREATVAFAVPQLASSGAVPEVGGRFQHFAQVLDGAGQRGESQPHAFLFVTPEDLMRILTDQLMIVRDQLREVTRRQKSARTDLEAFQKALGLAETFGADEAAKLYRHRQAQDRVTQALEREANTVAGILARMDRNKVSDEKSRLWIGGVSEELARLRARSADELAGGLERLKRDGAAAPQEVSKVAAIAVAQRQLERDVEALVLRLSEFGDLNAVIQLLRSVRQRQLDLREMTGARTRGGAPGEPQK